LRKRRLCDWRRFVMRVCEDSMYENLASLEGFRHKFSASQQDHEIVESERCHTPRHATLIFPWPPAPEFSSCCQPFVRERRRLDVGRCSRRGTEGQGSSSKETCPSPPLLLLIALSELTPLPVPARPTTESQSKRRRLLIHRPLISQFDDQRCSDRTFGTDEFEPGR